VRARVGGGARQDAKQAELAAARDELQRASERGESRNDELNSLRSDAERLRGELHAAAEQERRAKAETEREAAARAAVERELDGARGALEREQEAHATLRTGMSRSREEMERDAARMKAELDSLRRDAASHAAELEKLRRALDEARAARQSDELGVNAAAEAAREALARERMLQAQLAEETACMERARLEIRDLEARLLEADGEADRLRRKSESARAQADGAMEQVGRLKEELAGAREQLGGVHAELEELRGRAAAPPEDENAAAVEGMEAALGRMADILKRRDAELDAIKRTVNAECAERVRLLGLLQQLQPANGDLPPASADATLQSLPVNRSRDSLPAINQKQAFTATAERDQAVDWTMKRQPGKRGGRGGLGR